MKTLTSNGQRFDPPCHIMESPQGWPDTEAFCVICCQSESQILQVQDWPYISFQRSRGEPYQWSAVFRSPPPSLVRTTSMADDVRSPTSEPKMTKEEFMKGVQEALKSGGVFYECCFCHEAVPAAEVSAVGVITRWAHPEREQAYQQWFCHLSCFERVTGQTFEAEPGMSDDE